MQNLLTLNFDSADNITELKSLQDTYITWSWHWRIYCKNIQQTFHFHV